MNTHEPNNVSLQKFVEESKRRLKRVLERLHWSMDDVGRTSIEHNLVQKNTESMKDSEPELPASCAYKSSIITGTRELQTIVGDDCAQVPTKFSELQLNFTREQKLAIYNHVVESTKTNIGAEVTVEPLLGESNLTFADIVAQKKRETKKRHRYRRSKPTHIEEVRNMVDLQMQAFQQFLSTKAAEERREEEKEYSRHQRSISNSYIPDECSRRGTHDRNIHRHENSRGRSIERMKKGKHRNRSRSGSRSHRRKKHKKRSHDRIKGKRRGSPSHSRNRTHTHYFSDDNM